MAATADNMAAVRQLTAGLPPVVCYHHPCTDGVYAALAAWNALRRGGGPAPRFQPLTVYKDTAVADLRLSGDEAVFFLDFSGPRGFARELAAHCARVVVIDHHKTAADQLGVVLPPEHDYSKRDKGGAQQQQAEGGAGAAEPLPSNMHVLLDMNRSGAMLALDYFGRDGFPPEVVRAYGYVQDADLWTWRIPGSKEFHAGLGTLGLEYDAVTNPGIFEQLLGLDIREVVDKGRAVLTEQDLQIAAAVRGALRLKLGGAAGAGRGWGAALGCVVSGSLIGWRSALGNALAKRSKELGLQPVGVVAYVEAGMAPGKIKVSLRSVDEWATTQVTEALGGGGHRAASACVVDAAEFEAWKEGGAAERGAAAGQ